MAQEIPASALIDEIEKLMAAPGNSADTRVVSLLTRIKDHLQAKVSAGESR